MFTDDPRRILHFKVSRMTCLASRTWMTLAVSTAVEASKQKQLVLDGAPTARRVARNLLRTWADATPITVPQKGRSEKGSPK